MTADDMEVHLFGSRILDSAAHKFCCHNHSGAVNQTRKQPSLFCGSNIKDASVKWKQLGRVVPALPLGPQHSKPSVRGAQGWRIPNDGQDSNPPPSGRPAFRSATRYTTTAVIQDLNLFDDVAKQRASVVGSRIFSRVCNGTSSDVQNQKNRSKKHELKKKRMAL